MKGLLPISLDLDQHLTAYPPINFGIKIFNKDHLLFLLTQIVLVPASNRKVLDKIEENYVPLSSTIMQSVVHEYSQYWEYLQKTGIVEIRKTYFPKIFFNEARCKGYRLSFKYVEAPIKEEAYSECFTKKLAKKRIREHRKEFFEKREYLHVLKWLYPKCYLTIAYEESISFLKLEKKILIKKPELREKRNRGNDKIYKTGKTKNPYFQYELSKINIDKIHNAEVSFIIDETVNRLHTVLTNTRSLIRNYITYKGEKLVSIDLVNSQPYLSTKLLRTDFWIKATPSSINHINLYKNNKIKDNNKNKQTKEHNTPYMLEILKELVDSKEIMEFEAYVGYSENNDGDFYSFMEKKYNEKNIPHSGRQFIKGGVFEVFFSSNRYRTLPKKVFKEVFPTINKVFELIKEKDKASLPILLQKLESYIFLKVITKKIASRFPKAPIFTIHDSIVTTVEYCNEVKTIMFSELNRLIGIPPMLKVEKWDKNDSELIDKVKFYNGIMGEK